MTTIDTAGFQPRTLFTRGDYQPAILFKGFESVVEAAEKNPEALWKLENLKKMS